MVKSQFVVLLACITGAVSQYSGVDGSYYTDAMSSYKHNLYFGPYFGNVPPRSKPVKGRKPFRPRKPLTANAGADVIPQKPLAEVPVLPTPSRHLMSGSPPPMKISKPAGQPADGASQSLPPQSFYAMYNPYDSPHYFVFG